MEEEEVDVAKYERLANDVYIYGSVALALGMAKETDIVPCLCAAQKPLSSAEIAESLKLKERYVRELLNSLTVAGLVHLEGGSGGREGREGRYWVPPTLRPHLQRSSVLSLIVSSNARSFADVKKCFPIDGPYSSRYNANSFAVMDKIVHTNQDRLAEAVFQTPHLKNRVEKGLKVLDVGCGMGRLSLHIASLYPQSHFTLSDIVPEPLERARQESEKLGLSNVSFRTLDVCNLSDEMEENFDWVLCRNVIHDLPYPSKALEGICKVLKPGGDFSMLDIFASSYVAENVKQYPVTAALYADSTFNCIPESYQQEQVDSAALGNCWGEEKAWELVVGAGMEVLGVARFTHLDIRPSGICMCRKPTR